MKATKALRRLAKIESLLSDVTDRYVTLAPTVRRALKDANVAVTRAKEAVGRDASSVTSQRPGKRFKASLKPPKTTRTVGAAADKKASVKKYRKAQPTQVVAPIQKRTASKKTVSAQAQALSRR